MNATVSPPQLTVRAVILAIVLAMVLAAANTYLGLFAGMTIASAIPAAVVSMAVLRVLGGSYGVYRDTAVGLRWYSAKNIQTMTYDPTAITAQRYEVDTLMMDMNVRF